MSIYEFSGTNERDYIDTWNLNNTYSGYDGFNIYGNKGNDNISLSIYGRSGVDTAWGGTGDDLLSGHAYLSDYAYALFDGGYGNDRVYIPLMIPELNLDGKPNFTRTSSTTSQIKLLNPIDNTILTAIISDSVERIAFGSTGDTYLTEDLANNIINAVDWNEEYARTFFNNADWYLNGLNTYDIYHGLSGGSLNIGNLSNGIKKEYEASVKSSVDHNIFFSVNSDEYVYTYFQLTELSDDLDLTLHKADSTGEYKSIKYSEQPGNDNELFFKALENGSYKLTTSFYTDVDGSSSDSSFKLTIDAATFAQTYALPNDPYFNLQWSLFNTGQADGKDNEDILAPEAWNIANKSPDVVIAVIDGGVRTSHEDLRSNLWINSQEIAGNNIDDDGNGYIDDIYGWNFVNQANWWQPDSHGTHVAGLIAAEGNNSLGVSGVTWDAKLMSLDVFGSNKGATVTDIVDAIYYAANNGANVINMSLGSELLNSNLNGFKSEFPEVYNLYFNALTYAVQKGCVVVCAAGNSGLNTEKHFTIPASFSSYIPGVISVAAVANTGDITSYSNYSESVTIAAPGGDDRDGLGSKMLSTYHLSDDSYTYLAGTSMAAPLVSGAAALIMQVNKDLTPAQVEDVLTQSSYKYKSLEGLVDEGNYLDLQGALSYASSINYTPFTYEVAASTWSTALNINKQISGAGVKLLQAKQVSKSEFEGGPKGSQIFGNAENDLIRGLAGWDILDGGSGDDLIHGGNGRDVITGGSGSDELHGDFGWNTYTDQRDGAVDLIAIKSDQFLWNHWYGTAGNNTNGGKSDIINGLDSWDQIKIIGASQEKLSFRENIKHKGVEGIGIYADGALEALYIGGDLTLGQVAQMTSGDASELAMSNQIWSYWGNNSAPALLA